MHKKVKCQYKTTVEATRSIINPSLYNNDKHPPTWTIALTFFFGQIGKGEGRWIGFDFVGGGRV